MKILSRALIFALALLSFALSGCSSLRFVPEGKTLLQSVRMTSDAPDVKASGYRRFVRQEANTRWLGLLKVPLGIYRLSGRNSTRRINRFFQRIGEAPVVYDPSLTAYSCRSIEQTLQGRGYLNATVQADTVNRGRRTRVNYVLHPGGRSYVSQLGYTFDDARMEKIVLADEMQEGSLLYRGMPFDVTLLEEERRRITRHLQNIGYYGINQDFISFSADTLAGDYGVELRLNFRCPANLEPEQVYQPYTYGNVRIYETISTPAEADSSVYQGIRFYHERGLSRHVSRRVLAEHNYIQPGQTYSEQAQQFTYQSLNSLGIIHYSSIRTRALPDTLLSDTLHTIDTDIYLKMNRPNGLALELEGTNTAGDLGAAASLTYTHRNLFHGAESLGFKVRGAFEAIKGLEGYSDANFIEYGAELSLRLPRFLVPVKARFRRRVRATTEFSVLFNSQDRPEFHRRIWTGTWHYQWSPLHNPRLRHRFDLFSLNYLYMPWISNTFREKYLEDNSSRNTVLRYSYEDLFITKVGYGFTLNSQGQSGSQSLYNTNGYQLRVGSELAGTLPYVITRFHDFGRNGSGERLLGNVPYAQYFKFDIDYAKSVRLTEQSSLAFHAAFGVAVPYGNSTMIPYEKRYFSGGANSVRGWSVRELGPGTFVGKDGKVDFINQTGNLRLDLSVEYRARLFWKLHGAVFVDAGNIWNTRQYEGQDGGKFFWNSFYRQIAVAYGLGIRLNFDYFILRFDGGMKAVNPAEPHGKLHLPLLHPNFSRDFTFHFAVGLPF